MMKMLKSWRWALLIGVLLLIGLVYAFWPEAVPVDAGKVTRGPMQEGITDDGVTRAEEFYVVSAPVTGYLSRIELEPGDRVERGTLIARMEGVSPTPLDSRSREERREEVAVARAAEAGMASSLEQARRDLERAEELAGRGFLPRAQLEATRTRVATARAGLQQARAEARRAEAGLSAATGLPSGGAVPVRAPAGGSILSVVNESEGVIVQGTPLITIGDPDRIEAVIDLLSREAAKVRPGSRVEINQWGGSGPLLGHVERVEPIGQRKVSALGIEEQRVNVIVAFDSLTADQSARLGHGYQIDGTIVLWSRKDALRVPFGALFRGAGGGWRVFAIVKGRAVLRDVKIGHVDDEFGEVISGLTDDDVVVLNPSNSLESGDRVRIN